MDRYILEPLPFPWGVYPIPSLYSCLAGSTNLYANKRMKRLYIPVRRCLTSNSLGILPETQTSNILGSGHPPRHMPSGHSLGERHDQTKAFDRWLKYPPNTSHPRTSNPLPGSQSTAELSQALAQRADE